MSLLDANGNPLAPSMETVKGWRRMKMNPLRSLTARSLTRALDNFEYGHLRDAAMLFDVIAERDDTLKSVKPKREKEVSGLDWQIMPKKGVKAKDDVFQTQKEVLDGFWDSVRAVNAYDRNEKGKFGRLVRQMMSSASMRYAAHHIVWRPSADKLEATFEFIPLWLFENITGTLRYLRNPFATEGESLNPDEWMVTVGDGLMVACSIGYYAKRAAYNDWMIFSEKFSMPGVLGRTSAKKGSPEGDMMKQAVQTFGHDWAGVLYGDDGQHTSPIELIQADGNPSAMPQPALLERVDRKFAALYRGADLSTMSSKDGEGTGASLQSDEGDILLNDDAATIEETLESVSERVLQWHFGYNVEIQARLKIIVPTDENEVFLLKASTELADRGVPVCMNSTVEKMGIQLADEGDEVLKAKVSETEEVIDVDSEKIPNSKLQTPNTKEDEELTEEERFEFSARAMLDRARQNDLRGVGDQLLDILDLQDPEEFMEGIKKLDGDLPGRLSTSDESEDIWQAIYTSALANGFDDEIEDSKFKSEEANSGTRSGALKGWLTRMRKGRSREGKTKVRKDQFGALPKKGKPLTPKQNELRVWRAVGFVQSHKKDVPRVAFRKEVGAIGLPWGRKGTEAMQYKDGYGLSKIQVKHPHDVAMIPAVLSKGEFYEHDRYPKTKIYAVLGNSHLVALKRKDKRSAWVITSFEDPKTIKQIRKNQKRIQGG